MNTTKKTLAYLGGIAFTILGIWLLTMDTSTTTYPVWKIKVAGVLSVTFFGGSVLYMTYRKIRLIINHKKILSLLIAAFLSMELRKSCGVK